MFILAVMFSSCLRVGQDGGGVQGREALRPSQLRAGPPPRKDVLYLFEKLDSLDVLE